MKESCNNYYKINESQAAKSRTDFLVGRTAALRIECNLKSIPHV